MMPSIDLDDEPLGQTGEVGAVVADGHLATKLGAERSFAELFPEAMFGLGQRAAQLAGAAGDFVHAGDPACG